MASPGRTFEQKGPAVTSSGGGRPKGPPPHSRGRTHERGSPRPLTCPSASPPASPQTRVACRPRLLSEAYLRPDSLPVLVRELVAALVLQLLQNAAVYGQAVVDFCEELVYVRVVGAQDAVADLRELRTREGGRGRGDAACDRLGVGRAKRLPESRPPFSLTPLQSLPLKYFWGK